MYFAKFPSISYRFGSGLPLENFIDLSIYSTVIEGIKDAVTAYEYYVVRDGERPDIVAYNLYGRTDYYYLFYLMNDHIRESGWSLSYQDFQSFLRKKLPGYVAQCNGVTASINKPGELQHLLTEQFPIGTAVYGNTSGAAGVVYEKDLSMGQIFIESTNGISFETDTAIQSEPIGGQSAEYIAAVERMTTAPQAWRYFVDSNGEIVTDHDPTSPTVTGLEKVPVTNQDYLEALNETQSRIRVLKPAVAQRVHDLIRKSHVAY